MKDVLICLIGASGTGKTTIARRLEQAGYNVIQSYTTRHPRIKDEWGHTFIDRDEFPKYKVADMCAFQMIYDDIYFMTHNQYKNKGVSIYVVDPAGFAEVVEKAKCHAYGVLLHANVMTRRNRMIQRNEENSFGETMGKINARIKKDKDLFKLTKCDYAIDVSENIASIMPIVMEVLNDVKRREGIK